VFAAELAKHAAERSELPAVAVGSSRVVSFGVLAARVASAAKGMDHLPGQRVLVDTPDFERRLIALAALDNVGAAAVILPPGVAQSHRRWVTRVCGIGQPRGAEVDGSTQTQRLSRRHRTSEVILMTSGTSGSPKLVTHTWTTLAAAIRRESRYRGLAWLLGYDGASFAGLQVTLQALLTGGCVVAPSSADAVDTARAAAKHEVSHASGTPTFWRMFLAGTRRTDREGMALRQITLGGEKVDQGVLDSLRAAFPKARLSHIYASTEMGVCFTVTDGKAGFPTSYLEDSGTPCRLGIAEDGELLIRSSRAMRGYVGATDLGDNWFATGDLVEIRDDRTFFIGRKSEVINVGGSKVHPTMVEDVIRSVGGVRDARVRAVSSSLLGELVTAEVVPEPGSDRESLRAQVLATCRSRLARHETPTRVNFVERLDRTASGKVMRAT
jgi:acyl-CoA synthetase (AMP-forming)/AMP-acid ligase II